MKKLLGILFIISLGINVNAAQIENGGASLEKITSTDTKATGIIFFKGDWKAALKKAKKENKLIFLDSYASWCGPCKAMERRTFTDSKVGEFFNANFINVKMDMEKDPNGPRLSSKYKLQAYPTLFFVNGAEKKVDFSVGYLKPKQLISVGKRVMENH